MYRKEFLKRLSVHSILLAFIAALSACTPNFIDISPDAQYGSAGIIYALAGDSKALYAVSLNAGVWKSSPASGSSASWMQLPSSPRYAMSIAVDPNNANHLIVGERNGDTVAMLLNNAGLWESYNAGKTWTYILNPLTTGCYSQAIPAVAFAQDSSIIAATACGIARRGLPHFIGIGKLSTPAFTFPTIPNGGSINALSVGFSRIWARSTSPDVIYSDDSGASWQLAGDFNSTNETFTERGESFSLAGFDDAGFIAGHGASADTRAIALLVYQKSTQAWKTVELKDQDGISPVISDANGLGGKVSIRSFRAANGSFILILNTSEFVVQLTPNADYSSFTAKRLIAVNPVNTGGPQPTDPRFADPAGVYIHPDLWDFLVDPNADTYFAAGDGGIEQNASGSTWQIFNQGLHTHHSQTMDVMSSGATFSILYSTQDNDTWFSKSNLGNQWHHDGLGDVNWTSADEANPSFALAGRTVVCPDKTQSCSDMVEFNASSPSTVSTDSFSPACIDDSAPQFIQFIQTLPTETVGALDALMLIRRPCLSQSFTTALQFLSQSGSPAILRNENFSTNFNFGSGENWTLVADNLPTGSHVLYASHGHAPQLFVQSTDTAADGSVNEVLYEQQFEGLRGLRWVSIFSGIITPSRCAGPAGWYQSVYVDPYDSDKIILLTPQGVMRRANGQFSLDPVMTALLTDSGMYPITSAWCGAAPATDAAFAYARMVGTPTLGRTLFTTGGGTLISSPYTGAFFDSGDGIWRSLSYRLPTPTAPVFSVGLTSQDAYVAMAGRSVVRIPSPGSSKIASIITPQCQYIPELGGGLWVLAILSGGDKTVRLGAQVDIQTADQSGNVRFTETRTTDNKGRILSPVPGFGGEVSLSYAGDSDYAPINTRYVRSQSGCTSGQ